MASTSGSAPSGSFPRSIDPNKFAEARETEILALSDALKKSQLYGGDKYGINGLPRHLRRRAKSHNPYRHTKRPNKTKQSSQPSTDVIDDDHATTDNATFTNRRMRRKPTLLHQSALESCSWNEDAIVNNGINIGNKLRRLETHLWHAKRLAMQDYPDWGWTLPSGIAGRGRGSRSFYRKLGNSCIMHDASYMCPLFISGSGQMIAREDIVAFFSLFLDPRHAETIATEVIDKSNDSSSSSSGVVDTTMYSIEAFPFNAIGPCQILTYIDTTTTTSFGCCMWVHSAIAHQCYTTLQQAIHHHNNNNNNNNDDAMNFHLQLSVLNMRRIELRGKTSSDVLSKTFSFSNNRQQHNNGDGDSGGVQGMEDKKASSIKTIRSTTPVMMHSYLVPDPRLVKPVVFGSLSASLIDSNNNDNNNNNNTNMSIPSFFSMMQNSPPQPLSEAAISAHRATLRQQLALGQQHQSIDDPINNAAYCPILCIPSSSSSSTTTMKNDGCSVILPPGWVLAFWIALSFQGVQPIGQREWHWYHTITGQSFFPHDAVDTHAYHDVVQRAQQEKKDRDATIPKGQRLPNTTIQWSDVVVPSSSSTSTSTDHITYYIARHDDDIVERENENDHCFLVKVLIYFVKKGSASEHAMLCTINADDMMDVDDDHEATRYIHKDDLSLEQRKIIGYVSSPAPYGTPSGKVPSIGYCSWSMLKSCMSGNGKEEKIGGVYLQNPTSTALYPVVLELVF